MHTHKAEGKCDSILAFIVEERDERKKEKHFLHLSFK